MRDATCTYSIVVPCYNSGRWIDELVERVGRVMQGVDGSHELVLVNDASPDGTTWPAIKRNAQALSWVRGIDLHFNVGQFRALIAGIEAATGEFVITMDDDFQHPPEELPKLVTAIRDHPEMDAVIGAYREKKHSLSRNLGSRLTDRLFQRIYGKPPDLDSTSFRIMRRGLAEVVTAHRTAKPVLGAIIFQSTTRVMNVEVRHEPRAKGSSGYAPRRLIGATFDNVINASVAPLRLFGLFGMLIAFGAFVFGFVYFLRWALGIITEPGFITFVLMIAFFGGMSLLGIGLVGEYVARVIAEVTGAPRYCVREQID